MSNDMDTYSQSRTSEIYSDTIPLMVLASIAVALRLAARRISVAQLWWDDYLLVLALVTKNAQVLFLSVNTPNVFQLLNWALSACTWANTRSGLGRHTILHGGPVGVDHLITYSKVRAVGDASAIFI